MSPSEATSVCALHPESPATFTCGRCGSFGCDACRRESEENRCRACAERERAQATAGLEPGTLIRDTFHLLLENLPAVGLMMALAMVGLSLMGLVLTIAPWSFMGWGREGMMTQCLLQTALVLGYLRLTGRTGPDSLGTIDETAHAPRRHAWVGGPWCWCCGC